MEIFSGMKNGKHSHVCAMQNEAFHGGTFVTSCLADARFEFHNNFLITATNYSHMLYMYIFYIVSMSILINPTANGARRAAPCVGQIGRGDKKQSEIRRDTDFGWKRKASSGGREGSTNS